MATIDEQRAKASAQAAKNSNFSPGKLDGLRLTLKKISGVTQGDALKVLGKPYFFQCPPLDDFQVAMVRTWNRYTNYKGSEYLSRAGTQLMNLQFRTVVVEYGVYVVNRDWDLPNLIRNLQRLVDAGWPMQLTASHLYNDSPEVDSPVVLESVTATENAGEPDARYLDLSFIEWRDPVVNRAGLGSSGGGSGSSSGSGRGSGGGGSSDASAWPKTLILDKNGTGHVEGGQGRWEQITLATAAVNIYHSTSLGPHIAAAQKPPLTGIGMHTPIIEARRYAGKGGKLIIPKPPSTGGTSAL